jgi:hypothetical protein
MCYFLPKDVARNRGKLGGRSVEFQDETGKDSDLVKRHRIRPQDNESLVLVLLVDDPFESGLGDILSCHKRYTTCRDGSRDLSILSNPWTVHGGKVIWRIREGQAWQR